MRRFAVLKFNNMKSYKIPVIWSVTAEMEIEAESLEDAILKAKKKISTQTQSNHCFQAVAKKMFGENASVCYTE